MIDNMPELALRDDDVMFCSYPKSGCHWIFEVARMIINGHTELDTLPKERYMLEASGGRHGNVADLPSPRIMNNHQPAYNQPGDIY